MAARDKDNSQLPWSHQLEALIDFIQNDDRPTFIFDTETRRLLIRNPAFDLHLLETDSSRELQSWVQSFPTVAKPEVVGTIELGAFAQEEWIGKSVGKPLVTVFCRRRPLLAAQKTNNTPASPAKKEDTLPVRDGPDGHPQRLSEMRMGWLEPRDDPWMSFIREYPFEETAIGPISDWDPQLQRSVQTMMTCPETRILYWGDSLAMVYNEAAVSIVGAKHPSSLGMPLMETWGQGVHDQIVMTIQAVIKSGRAQQARDVMFVLERNGFPEETWHHFHQLPITSSEGLYLGCVCEFVENTTAVVQKNRATVIDTAIKAASRAIHHTQLWSGIVDILVDSSLDISSALLYSVDHGDIQAGSADSRHAPPNYTCENSFGFPDMPPGTAPSSSLAQTFNTFPNVENLLVLRKDDDTLPTDLAWPLKEKGTITTVCIFSIADLNKRTLAFLVLGMNPRRPFDEGSRNFVLSLGDLLRKSAIFITLPEEQRRNQEMTSGLSHRLQIALLKAERAEEIYARMARDAPIGMYRLRPDGYPIFVNDAYLELIGMTRTQFYRDAELGLGWSNTIYDEDVTLAAELWKATTEGKKPVQAELRVKAPTRTSPSRVRWLESLSYCERDESDNVTSVQGWLLDIGSRKLTERLVAEKLQDALENKRATETFLDMLSHEMRNPLSSILQLADGILGLLAGSETSSKVDTESLTDAAQTITLCAKHQKTIIDEVLTFSKLDSNLLVLSLEKAQIPTIIETALKMFEMELNHAQINASMKIEQSYIDMALNYVLVDPSRLLQVIINFLTNSIKFTRNAKTRLVTIHVAASTTKLTEDSFGIPFLAPRKDASKEVIVPPDSSPVLQEHTGEEVYIYIGVEDTGKGLTEDETKVLFQRFAQASPKTHKTYGGSGLGLFISRGLVELQGGQIGVKSKAGVGSTFGFFIKTQAVEPPVPVARSNSVASVEASTDVSVLPQKDGEQGVKVLTRTNTAEISNVSVNDLHILVVEDNAINQKVIAQQLRRLGVNTVHLADHGLHALEFINTTKFSRSAGPEHVPLSLVLLDVEMPVLDGLSCVRRIRELEATGEISRHVPIIAITANARVEQVAVALEAGMDEVVTKPFRIPELIPRMEALVQKFPPPS